jgi:hypothetical protein
MAVRVLDLAAAISFYGANQNQKMYRKLQHL